MGIVGDSLFSVLANRRWTSGALWSTVINSDYFQAIGSGSGVLNRIATEKEKLGVHQPEVTVKETKEREKEWKEKEKEKERRNEWTDELIKFIN